MLLSDCFSAFAQRLQPNAIRSLAHLINRPGMITFAGGVPSPETFPIAEIAEIASRMITEQGASVLQYGVTRGNALLRDYVLARMQTQSITATMEELLLTSGSQQALDLVARVLIEPGDVVLVELPSYIGGTAALHNAGAELIGIPMQEDGLDPDAIATQITQLRQQGKRVKLLYTIPNFQNPSGITLSAIKRQQLLDLAIRENFLILEDDPYGELYFDAPPPPAIRSLEHHDRVIYLGSFSKILTPGLRTAWVLAPAPLAERLERAKEAADLCSSMLDQAIVAECCRQGLIANRLSALRDFYRQRCQAMLDALNTYAPANTWWTKPTGGLFVWWELPSHCDATALLPAAVAQKIAYVPGAPFFVTNAKPHSLRLAFSKESPSRITEGIAQLCTLFTTISPSL
jgi:2-aminoadipate transaminase